MNCNLRLHEFSLSLNELRRSSHELQAVGLHCGIIPKCTPRVQFTTATPSIHARRAIHARKTCNSLIKFVMNTEIEKKIGNNVRALRERAGMTQELLATKLQLQGCDITRSAVAKIEVGQRHLYPDEIILLKEILKATYEEIFDVK